MMPITKEEMDFVFNELSKPKGKKNLAPLRAQVTLGPKGQRDCISLLKVVENESQKHLQIAIHTRKNKYELVQIVTNSFGKPQILNSVDHTQITIIIRKLIKRMQAGDLKGMDTSDWEGWYIKAIKPGKKNKSIAEAVVDEFIPQEIADKMWEWGFNAYYYA